METRHTPGPWDADDGDGHYFGVFGANGEPLAYLVETSSTHDLALPGNWVKHPGGEWECRRTEHAANARLIAAAPDLLAALRECADTLAIRAANGSVPRIDEPALIKAAEAIEKATQP